MSLICVLWAGVDTIVPICNATQSAHQALCRRKLATIVDGDGQTQTWWSGWKEGICCYYGFGDRNTTFDTVAEQLLTCEH